MRKIVHGDRVISWTRGVDVDIKAMEQIHRMAKLPFLYRHIAVMPDAHVGRGSCVGTVIPTIGAVIPAAVGVDIGCGMMATPLELTASDLPDNLSGVRSTIESMIPHGRTANGRPGADRGAWTQPPDSVTRRFKPLSESLNEILSRHPNLLRSGSAETRALNHLGTLGTGNHFVELCLDENDRVWVMLHSGSRGIGNAIGSYFIEIAKKEMRRWFVNLPDEDLAYLPEGTDHFDSYITAVEWAQKYAVQNRWAMMIAAIGAIAVALNRTVYVHADPAVECHHNFVSRENHFGKNVLVTRKGAVRARSSDLGIIPGSMGAKSFIVRGKGNLDSFASCSHGAGRSMSRAEARRRFTVEEHARATEGVECRADESTLDETPMAYKDIDAVMKSQNELVEVVHTLRQVVCVKG